MARRTPSIDRCHGLRRNSRSHGFTLAESLIASVVLAVAVVAVSGAIVASQSQTSAHEQDIVAVSLARQLMEEIVARPLANPDTTSGFPTITDRSTYDAVNDFSGYTDTVSFPVQRSSTLASATFSSALPTATVITAVNPNIHLNPQQYSRIVTITYPTSPFGASVTAGDFAVVKVNVQGAGTGSAVISRVVAKVPVTR